MCFGYAATVAVAVAAGAGLAAGQGQVLFVPQHLDAQATETAFLFRVLESNLRVWLYTCAGLVSFGVAGLFVVTGNAFRFGMDAMSMASGAPRELAYLLPHAALEFTAFTLAGASCQYLAWCLFDLLVMRRTRASPRPGAQMLALSFVLLMLAACLETYTRSARVA